MNLTFFAIQGLITTDQGEYPAGVQTIVQQGMGDREMEKCEKKQRNKTKQGRGRHRVDHQAKP